MSLAAASTGTCQRTLHSSTCSVWQPVDNRSWASHAKFHLERSCICLRQKAIKGSFHSHGRGGCIVLLQCFIIWQLHVVEAHQSTQKVCIHLAHGDQPEMRIHCHCFQRCHWATIVQAAKRQTQLVAWRVHQHDSWLKPQAGTNVATLQFQGLLEVVLLEGETEWSEPNMSIYLSIYSETSATPEVARTCRQEQPIEDIGSTGRVNESSRLSVAKLKLNGVRNVYQTCQGDVKTCQGDVKTCQGDGKAETEWSEPSMSI